MMAIEKLSTTNARVHQNQADYKRRFDNLSTDHDDLLQQHSAVLVKLTDLQNRFNAYEHYKIIFSALHVAEIEFTPDLGHTLTATSQVTTDGMITFTFRDGSQSPVKYHSSHHG